MRDLPADDRRAVVGLRQFVARETTPSAATIRMCSWRPCCIDHGMPSHLRWMSMTTCGGADDGEMDGIRQACMAEWGQVPSWRLTGRWPSVSRRLSVSNKHCGGPSAGLRSTRTTLRAQRRSKTCGAGRRRTRRDSRLAFSIPMPHQRSATPRMKPWSAWPAGEPSTDPVCEAGSRCGAQSAPAPRRGLRRTTPHLTRSRLEPYVEFHPSTLNSIPAWPARTRQLALCGSCILFLR